MTETDDGVPWFAANLRRAREAAGLSQQELVRRVARELGRRFSQQSYSAIETGKREPALSIALVLARQVGASLEFLAQPPAEARAALEIADAARRTQDARHAAQVAAAAFRNSQEDLRRLAGRVRPGESAGKMAADALALTLDLDEE